MHSTKSCIALERKAIRLLARGTILGILVAAAMVALVPSLASKTPFHAAAPIFTVQKAPAKKVTAKKAAVKKPAAKKTASKKTTTAKKK